MECSKRIYVNHIGSSNSLLNTRIYKMNKREYIILGFVLMAVVRLLPHPPNFTPITALALFGATTFKNKYLGVFLPLIAMVLSDIYLGFYGITLWVYGSFLLISLLGRYWKEIKLVTFSIISDIFHNHQLWSLVRWLPKTWEGFLLCYTMKNSLLYKLYIR